MESRYTLSIVVTEIKIEGFEYENKVVSSREKPGPDTCKLTFQATFRSGFSPANLRVFWGRNAASSPLDSRAWGPSMKLNI